jgi:hypothetical protein
MDIWDVRAFVYQHFADTTRAPGMEEAARYFNISNEEAGRLYRELNDRHAIFLEAGSLNIRMANPFSNIPTDFKVHANGKTYFANCAWDMLGIPAALGCDAVIDAVFTESNDAVRLEIMDGNLALGGVLAAGDGGWSSFLVHFPLPFARWYDDLVFT